MRAHSRSLSPTPKCLRLAPDAWRHPPRWNAEEKNGVYQVLFEREGLEQFRLAGRVARGVGAVHSKFIYLVSSSTTDHNLYRVDMPARTVSAGASLKQTPAAWGWTPIPSSADRLEFAVPAEQLDSHVAGHRNPHAARRRVPGLWPADLRLGL